MGRNSGSQHNLKVIHYFFGLLLIALIQGKTSKSWETTANIPYTRARPSFLEKKSRREIVGTKNQGVFLASIFFRGCVE